MKLSPRIALVALAAASLTACTSAYTGPVEVTRFVAERPAALGQGAITIELPGEEELSNRNAREAFADAVALVDRALRWEELGEDDLGAPAQNAEFVLYHGDNVQATGFLEHIKLPHYVDFQSEQELIRKLRAEAMAARMPEAAE